jgi:hypothetical protein
VFSRFEVPPTAPRAVGVALHPLADALAVFAALPPAELDITLPGTAGGLDLEAGDAAATGGGGRTHARVDTAEPPRAAPPPPAASGGEAYLLAPHALLREAVDDLEWAAGVAGGTARLALDRDPPGARLLAAGAGGTVEVALPTDRLDAFDMPFPTARHAYRHRHLRAAFGAPPAPRGASGDLPPPPIASKLAVDGTGVLRVTHMVPLEAGAAPGGPAAVIQFAMLPEVDVGGDGESSDEGGSGGGDE